MDSMKTRLENLPRYQTEHTVVEAPLLNLIKLALIRIKSPLRLSISSLKNIDVILEHEYWACIDSSLNDIPVLAWTDFQTSARSDLHTPIDCKLYSFHAQADLIINTVINDIQSQLKSRLST